MRIVVIETTEDPRRLSIPSLELYVVLILLKSREQSTLGFLAGNNLSRMMIQHNAVSNFYLGTTNMEFKLCYNGTKVDILSLGFYIYFFLFNSGDISDYQTYLNIISIE